MSCATAAKEAREDQAFLLWGYSDSRVGDRDAGPGAVATHGDLERAAVRCVLDRVGEQVREDLGEPIAIPPTDERTLRLHHRDGVLLRLAAHLIGRGVRDLYQVHGVPLQLQPARLQTRRIHQVADQPVHARGLFDDDVHDRGVVLVTPPEKLGVALE